MSGKRYPNMVLYMTVKKSNIRNKKESTEVLDTNNENNLEIRCCVFSIVDILVLPVQSSRETNARNYIQE